MKYENGKKFYKLTKSGNIKEIVLEQAYILKGAEVRKKYCTDKDIDELIKREELISYEEAKILKIKKLEEELGIKLKEE